VVLAAPEKDDGEMSATLRVNGKGPDKELLLISYFRFFVYNITTFLWWEWLFPPKEVPFCTHSQPKRF